MIKNFRFTFYNILSIIFLTYGIGLFIFGGYNVGNLMVFGLGLTFLFFELCKSKFNKNKTLKIVRIIITAGIFITAILMIFALISPGVPISDKKEDALIVLGCGLNGSEVSHTLKKRLDACIEYNKRKSKRNNNRERWSGFLEEVTEASAMEKYLVENNVPEEKIIQEAESSSTYENFVNSKKILDNIFNDNYKTAFITNNFHCYRSYNLAENAGISVSAFRADDEWKTAFPSYLRESLAIVKLWIIGK